MGYDVGVERGIMPHQFNEDELYELEDLLNDAIFANRKRLQHCQGKVNLNIEGASAGVYEGDEEECRERLHNALMWYVKMNQIRNQEENS